MARVVGYYLTKRNGMVDTDTKYTTRRGAFSIAEDIISLGNQKVVGLVRANDMVLILKISKKYGKLTIEKP